MSRDLGKAQANQIEKENFSIYDEIYNGSHRETNSNFEKTKPKFGQRRRRASTKTDQESRPAGRSFKSLINASPHPTRARKMKKRQNKDSYFNKLERFKNRNSSQRGMGEVSEIQVPSDNKKRVSPDLNLYTPTRSGYPKAPVSNDSIKNLYRPANMVQKARQNPENESLTDLDQFNDYLERYSQHLRMEGSCADDSISMGSVMMMRQSGSVFSQSPVPKRKSSLGVLKHRFSVISRQSGGLAGPSEKLRRSLLGRGTKNDFRKLPGMGHFFARGFEDFEALETQIYSKEGVEKATLIDLADRSYDWSRRSLLTPGPTEKIRSFRDIKISRLGHTADMARDKERSFMKEGRFGPGYRSRTKDHNSKRNSPGASDTSQAGRRTELSDSNSAFNSSEVSKKKRKYFRSQKATRKQAKSKPGNTSLNGKRYRTGVEYAIKIPKSGTSKLEKELRKRQSETWEFRKRHQNSVSKIEEVFQNRVQNGTSKSTKFKHKSKKIEIRIGNKKLGVLEIDPEHPEDIHFIKKRENHRISEIRNSHVENCCFKWRSESLSVESKNSQNLGTRLEFFKGKNGKLTSVLKRKKEQIRISSQKKLVRLVSPGQPRKRGKRRQKMIRDCQNLINQEKRDASILSLKSGNSTVSQEKGSAFFPEESYNKRRNRHPAKHKRKRNLVKDPARFVKETLKKRNLRSKKSRRQKKGDNQKQKKKTKNSIRKISHKGPIQTVLKFENKSVCDGVKSCQMGPAKHFFRQNMKPFAQVDQTGLSSSQFRHSTQLNSNKSRNKNRNLFGSLISAKSDGYSVGMSDNPELERSFAIAKSLLRSGVSSGNRKLRARSNSKSISALKKEHEIRRISVSSKISQKKIFERMLERSGGSGKGCRASQRERVGKHQLRFASIGGDGEKQTRGSGQNWFTGGTGDCMKAGLVGNAQEKGLVLGVENQDGEPEEAGKVHKCKDQKSEQNLDNIPQDKTQNTNCETSMTATKPKRTPRNTPKFKKKGPQISHIRKITFSKNAGPKSRSHNQREKSGKSGTYFRTQTSSKQEAGRSLENVQRNTERSLARAKQTKIKRRLLERSYRSSRQLEKTLRSLSKMQPGLVSKDLKPSESEVFFYFGQRSSKFAPIRTHDPVQLKNLIDSENILGRDFLLSSQKIARSSGNFLTQNTSTGQTQIKPSSFASGANDQPKFGIVTPKGSSIPFGLPSSTFESSNFHPNVSSIQRPHFYKNQNICRTIEYGTHVNKQTNDFDKNSNRMLTVSGQRQEDSQISRYNCDLIDRLNLKGNLGTSQEKGSQLGKMTDFFKYLKNRKGEGFEGRIFRTETTIDQPDTANNDGRCGAPQTPMQISNLTNQHSLGHIDSSSNTPTLFHKKIRERDQSVSKLQMKPKLEQTQPALKLGDQTHLLLQKKSILSRSNLRSLLSDHGVGNEDKFLQSMSMKPQFYKKREMNYKSQQLGVAGVGQGSQRERRSSQSNKQFVRNKIADSDLVNLQISDSRANPKKRGIQRFKKKMFSENSNFTKTKKTTQFLKIGKLTRKSLRSQTEKSKIGLLRNAINLPESNSCMGLHTSSPSGQLRTPKAFGKRHPASFSCINSKSALVQRSSIQNRIQRKGKGKLLSQKIKENLRRGACARPIKLGSSLRRMKENKLRVFRGKKTKVDFKRMRKLGGSHKSQNMAENSRDQSRGVGKGDKRTEQNSVLKKLLDYIGGQ